MLDANDPTFQQQHPNGAIVRDRLGRQLRGVMACDPETGEVIRHDKSRIVGAFLRMVRGREQHWELPAEFRRHGFHPAPLTIEPIPARWNPPEFVPTELPELLCWYNADDGVCVDSETGQKFLRDLSGNGGRLIVSDEVGEAISIDNH
jgi:hypothetical protein